MKKKKREIMGLRPDGRKRSTERNMQIEKKWENTASGKGKLFFY